MPLPSQREKLREFLKAYGLALVVLAAVIIGLTLLTVHHAQRHHEDREIARLQAVAELKARQIADWLSERRADAIYASASAYLAQQYQGYRHGDIAAGTRLRNRLEQLRHAYNYLGISLLDPQGRLLWTTLARPPSPPAPERLAQARPDAPLRLGPYRTADAALRIDHIAPLALSPAPYLILHADPQAWLFPVLQTWPAPSLSGESLLFRRDGDSVLFLNELRHRQGAAGRLRLSLNNPELLAAQVLLGRVKPGQIIHGRDYRGIEVIGVARAIPGSDWHLIAKVDRDELYAESRSDAAVIALTGLLGLLMAVSGLALARQRQRTAEEATRWREQEERLRALQLLGAIADGSEDAIYAKDLQGRFLLFNRAAGHIVDRQPETVLGRSDRDLFPADQAERLMAADRQVIRQGQTLRSEEKLSTALGERILLDTKAPLRDEQGRITGVFGISRDITASKLAELEMERMADDMTATLQALPDLLFEVDAEGRFHGWHAANPSLLACPPDLFMHRKADDVLPPEAASVIRAALDAAGRTGTDYGRVIVLDLPDGQRRFELSVARKRLMGDQAPHFIVLSRDITSRHAAEQELLRSYEELQRFNQASVGRELDMIELKRQINALNRELGRPAPHDLSFLDGGEPG